MRVFLLGSWLCVCAMTGLAHRLDEYLQATRIAVATDRINFNFELTPGVAIAGNALELIDHDRDGLVSREEGNAYAGRFLKDVNVGLDGMGLALSLATVTFPALPEIRSGTGIIRIRATTVVGPLEAGEHVLTLTNGHLSTISVYQVNALQSKDPAVELGKQSRDERQKGYRLEFRVTPSGLRPAEKP